MSNAKNDKLYDVIDNTRVVSFGYTVVISVAQTYNCNFKSMKPEKDNSEIQLRPEAPAYVPIKKDNTIQATLQHFALKEPQCSRYSRKSVRRISDPNGPRPILGTKTPFPRPILGRKEINVENENEAIEDYIGMEFRSISRRMQRVKINEDEKGKTNNRRKTKS
ncbi:hypothetical protein FQR65_LT05513 [Abscondita terminalis]|nr:hypothetical protein FQR65_LT05513 [Abscondita terminalis]